MTISANSDWLPEWDSVIRMSLQLAGLVPLGKTPSVQQTAHARFFLDSFLKDMKNDVYSLSQRELTTTTLVAGTQAYALPADSIEIDFPIMLLATGDTVETQVDAMSYEQFSEIVDKQTTSLPTRCYLEKTATTTLYFWPVPDKAFRASYRRRRLVRNADSGTTPDMTAGWIRGVAFQLAADMGRCGSMDQAVISDRQAMADKLLDRAKHREHDEVDMTFVLPDYR